MLVWNEIDVLTVLEVEPEVEPEPIQDNDSKLDESLKSSLDNIDPWLQNKLEKESP